MKNIKYFILIFLSYSCANFIAPTGGEQDKEPPILLSSIPENQSKNFKGKEIFLEFDELIDASEIYNQLTVSPKLEKSYETRVKNNTLRIRFEEEFKDSTTYAFYFKNSIKDLTEKNAARNLKLIFSTYDKIDSLELSGQIQNIYTKDPILDATVALYPYDTTSIYNRDPMYFALTDSLGNYKIENIKDNNYFLMAFTDDNNNLRYDQDNELMAFVRDSINLTENIKQEKLELFKSNNNALRIRRTQIQEYAYIVSLNKPILEAQIEYENEQDSSEVYLEMKTDQLLFHKLTDNQLDTLHTSVIIKDSLMNTDTLNLKINFRERGRRKRNEILRIQSDIANNQSITQNIYYNLYFTSPIKEARLNKIQILSDTLALENINIEQKSPLHFIISKEGVNGEQIELNIPSNTFESINGDTNTLFKLINPILIDSELGLIEGGVKDTSEIEKIAILKNFKSNKEISRMTFKEQFLFEKLIPGEYRIEIIFDVNKNGIWDTGNVEKGILPEKLLVTPHPIRVRSNYEIRNLIVE